MKPEWIAFGKQIDAPPVAGSLQAIANLSEIATARPQPCSRRWDDPVFAEAHRAAKNSFLAEDDVGDVWTRSFRWVRRLFGGYRKVRVGDCEEGADHFKDILAGLGVPYGSMSFALLERGPQKAHMVLAVDTASDGTLIFDILAGSPMRYRFAGAKWLAAFSPGDTLWREIIGEKDDD